MKKIKNNEKEELQLNVMRILARKSKISQRQLAEITGVSLGTVNYCLHALAEKGWVKFENFSSSNNKRDYGYLLTPSGLKKKSQLTINFLRLKVDEYRTLQNEIDELRIEVDGR